LTTTLAIPAAFEEHWRHGFVVAVAVAALVASVRVNDRLDMPYNSYYTPIEIGLERVDHVDSMRHDAVRHVEIAVAVVHYDHDEDDDDRVVDMVVVVAAAVV
jgi:hypothetical protein